VGLDDHGLRLRNAVEKVIKVGKVIEFQKFEEIVRGMDAKSCSVTVYSDMRKLMNV